MGSRQPERYIPHVRDVFHRSSAGSGRKEEEGSDEEHHEYDATRTSAAAAYPHRSNHAAANHVYSRTLTEKDLKHIERHLSMKKTIRKQLSRHLSKAFVDADDAANKNSANTASRSQQQHRPLTTNSTTELKKEVGGSREEEDDDSGHCSPTTDIDRVRLDQRWTKKSHQSSSRDHLDSSSSSSTPSTKKNNSLNASSSTSIDTADAKKSNFWKKLTIRAKSKRN